MSGFDAPQGDAARTSPEGAAFGPSDLRDRLLHDADRDGFADTLRYPVWLASGSAAGDVDAAVASAAELLAVLAAGALQLAVDVRTWPCEAPGFCIGAAPPAASTPARDAGNELVLQAGGAARLTWSGDALTARADDAAALYPAVTAWLDAHRGGHGDEPRVPAPRASGVALAGGAPEALLVALRVALAAVDVGDRMVVADHDAALRTALDPSLAAGRWQIRTAERDGRATLEIVGHDREALGLACRWYASNYPRLPDGTWIDDLEDRLNRFVRGQTRDGRVAAAAAALRIARSRGQRPERAELPSPPAAAARQLGLPVRNSARDGELLRWSFRQAWEGERLLDVATELAAALGADDRSLRIEAYASERADVRAELAPRLAAPFERASLRVGEVRVRHAYRPALHWLLEEIEPHLPASTRRMRISVGRAADSDGAADRWLRELYPVAELLEARRPGLVVDLDLGPEQRTPRYLVEALDDQGRRIASESLAPPLAASPLTTGTAVPVTTGAVRVLAADEVIAERLVASDAGAFWSWFALQVIPALTGRIEPDASPCFHEIAVVAALSEPDERLPLDHETDSVLEALHEDVYFGLLEAFDQALASGAPRQVNPGRILPFLRGREAAEARAHVTVRAWGSDRIGVTTAAGAFVAAPACDATVHLRALHGRGAELQSLTLVADRTEAVERLLWASNACPETFPGGLGIHLAGADGAAHPTALGPFARPASATPLPARPLHPREVVAHARAWVAARPDVRLAIPFESALGQPLPVLELGWPAGPAVSRARRAAWKPTVLVSCRQHANEATSTNAAFAWLTDLLHDGELLRFANVVVHPLENPDGARLHAALCSLAPNHMHHAARYTAFGADLQSEPRVRGETIGESRLRRDTAARWRPLLHLNNHGYPAHAWVRLQTGFVPRGFEDWSLPVGHLTIVSTHGDDEGEASALRTTIAQEVAGALRADVGVRRRTYAQVARSLRYRPFANVPFVYHQGFPFWLNHRPRPEPPAERSEPLASLAPLVTVITEVPDETVAADDWLACVRAHVAVNQAVSRVLLAWLGGDAVGGTRRVPAATRS